jgi:hypothetical protein
MTIRAAGRLTTTRDVLEGAEDSVELRVPRLRAAAAPELLPAVPVEVVRRLLVSSAWCGGTRKLMRSLDGFRPWDPLEWK